MSRLGANRNPYRSIFHIARDACPENRQIAWSIEVQEELIRIDFFVFKNKWVSIRFFLHFVVDQGHNHAESTECL
jgi:hypothetical protein